MSERDTPTRRHFLFRASAALAAPAALAAAGPATAGAGEDKTLELLAALEDANAIRALQRAYIRHVNAGETEAAAALCVNPQRAALDGTIRELVADAHEDALIAVAADRRTATVRLPCAVNIATPIDAPGCTLVEMARLQGEGVLRRTERGVLEQALVRSAGAWRIERSVWRKVRDA